MYADPGHRLLLVPESSELLDLRFLGGNNCMAAHTGAHGRYPRVRRLVRREVAIDAIHFEGLNVRRMRKANRLNRGITLTRRSCAIRRQNCREGRECEKPGNRQPAFAHVDPRDFFQKAIHFLDVVKNFTRKTFAGKLFHIRLYASGQPLSFNAFSARILSIVRKTSIAMARKRTTSRESGAAL